MCNIYIFYILHIHLYQLSLCICDFTESLVSDISFLFGAGPFCFYNRIRYVKCLIVLTNCTLGKKGPKTITAGVDF